MLPHKSRLIKKQDFKDVHQQGKFFYFGNIALKMKKNGRKETRIGFSIGLNFSKKAVERNRVKRRLRNIFHKHIKEIKKGLDIVVIMKKDKKQVFDWEKLNSNAGSILAKAKLINNDKKQ